jgi:hypothetical protein
MDNSIAFSIYDCNKRKVVLVTHSAKRAKESLNKGFKVEVWNGQRLLQTLYKKDEATLDVWIDFFNETSVERTKAIQKIERFAMSGEISTQQYQVLKGLVEHNNISGAMKGLYKILRRNKKGVIEWQGG